MTNIGNKYYRLFDCYKLNYEDELAHQSMCLIKDLAVIGIIVMTKDLKVQELARKSDKYSYNVYYELTESNLENPFKHFRAIPIGALHTRTKARNPFIKE